MAKKNPGVSVTAVISPLDRLKLEVLVRDEILTRGQNSSVSSMVNTFLGIMLSSSLMQKKILACAEQQVAQDAKLGRTDSPAQRVLAAHRGAPPLPTQPSQPRPAVAPQPQPEEPQPISEPVELPQPTFSLDDLASLNPGLCVASKVRPAGYPGSVAPPAEVTDEEPEPEFGDSRRARGLLG